LNESQPSAAPRVLLTAARSAAIRRLQPARPGLELAPDRRSEPPSEPARKGESTPAAPAGAPAATRSGSTASPDAPRLAHHAAGRLAGLRAGQSKDEVFGLFGSMFTTQDQAIVEIQGMRLRATGQSAGGARIEIGEVSLADASGRETLYWFLFSDGRLLAWGRPEQWAAAATRYGIDLQYRPGPLRVEAKADLPSGR
jgi:hypothetical protein